tara:strand:+ start:1132 stop:1587 length:456 start_codon:yes stop_codon:yes gene_type:complete
MRFQKLTGKPDFELAGYVEQYLSDNKMSDIKIYLGCDSQNKSTETVYATTLVFHVGNSGCHVIYKKERVPKIRDMWERLWKECEKSVDVALYLRENNIEINTIDLDYNIDPTKKSSKLVKAAMGYVNGCGFKARCKPELLPGCYAADGIVN